MRNFCFCNVKFKGNFDHLYSVLPHRTSNGVCFELQRIKKIYQKEETTLQEDIHENQNENDNENSPVIWCSHTSKLLAWNNRKWKKQFKQQQMLYARNIKNIYRTNIDQKQEESEEQKEEQNIGNNELFTVVEEAMKNMGKGNGKRYSPASRVFWIRLRLFSRKAFAMMKKYLEGPSESNLELWIKNEQNVPKCNTLENIAQIDNIYQF